MDDDVLGVLPDDSHDVYRVIIDRLGGTETLYVAEDDLEEAKQNYIEAYGKTDAPEVSHPDGTVIYGKCDEVSMKIIPA